MWVLRVRLIGPYKCMSLTSAVGRITASDHESALMPAAELTLATLSVPRMLIPMERRTEKRDDFDRRDSPSSHQVGQSCLTPRLNAVIA